MNSLQGHLDVLTASKEALSASFLNSDFLKGAIDGLTGFINILNGLVNKIGALGTIGLGAGIAGIIINFKELKSLFLEISSIDIASSISKIGNISKIVDGGTGLLTSASVTELSASLEGLSLQQAKVVLSTTTLTNAQKEQVLVAAGLVASENSISAAMATEAMAKAGLSTETQALIAQELGLKVATDTCTEAELRKALATQGIVGANAEAVISNLGLTASNTTTAFSFNALATSIGVASKALITFLATNPIGWAIAAGAAIFSVVKIVDAFTESYEEAQTKAEDARKEVEDATSEYQSVGDELQAVKDKIDEINSLGGAKVVKDGELAQLQKQEKVLENQLKIKEKIANKALQKSADASNNLLTKKKRVQTGTKNMPDGSIQMSYDNLDIIDETEYYYQTLEKTQEKYEKLLEKHKNTKIEESSWWQNDTEWEKEEKQLKQYELSIEEMDNKITDNLKSISEEYDSLSDSTGNALRGCEDTVKRINELYKHVSDDINDTKSTFITNSDINEITEEIETLKENIHSLNEDKRNGIEIDDSELDELKSSLDEAKKKKNELMSENKIQVDSAKELLYAQFPDNKDLSKWFKNLSSKEKEVVYKIAFEEDISSYSLDDLENRLTELSMSSTMVQVHVDLTDSIKNITELSSEISAIQSVVNSHSTGIGISPDDLESIVGYESALEYVNGTIQLNEEKVRSLTEAKINEQIATNEATKTQEQVKYLENAKQIEILSNKLQNEKNLTKETTDAIRTRIETLNSENSFIMTNCNQLDMLNSSLSESIGLYRSWKDAQNASESGDMFDDTLTAMKLINDTIKNVESENYGRVGRKDYQASVDLLIPDTVDSEDTDAINKYFNSIKDLFVFDEDKNANALNIDKFCKKAVEKGLMVINEETKSYEVAGGKLMEDFAKGMNLSMPLVQAMFGELEEHGGKFDWGDEVFQTFGDGIVAATEQVTILTTKLNDLKEQQNNGIDIDDSKIKKVQKELEKANELKEKLTKKSSRNIDSYIDIDEQIKEQEKLVGSLNEKVKNTKGKKAKIEVEADFSEAKKQLADLRQEQKQLQEPTQLELTLKDNDIEAKIQSINDKISNYKDEKWVAEFAAELSDEEVNQKITELESRKKELEEKQIDIQAYLNDDEANTDIETLDKKEIQDKEFKIKAITDEAEKAIDNIEKKLLNLPKEKNINITTSTTEKKQTIIDKIVNKVTGKNKVNGTAHVSGTAKISGTAKASGDWGNKETGKTLVGELGREIVVNPHTGKWYTVGDNGAEFVNVPKNAIVFNHNQTEDLLSKGFVASRAVAMAKGTAYTSGTAMASGNAMVSGGIAFKNVDRVSKRIEEASKNIEKATSKNSKSSSDKESKSKSSKSDKSDKTDKILEKFQEWTSKFFDWIEIRLSRVQDKIDINIKKAESYAEKEKYNKSAKQYKKAINNTNTLINANKRGSKRYIQQANKVANKAVSDGLVSKKQMTNIKKRVANGTIDIAKYNERTQEVINSYKEFYDKSKDCSKAIFDLKNNMKDYYDSLYNLPLDKAANAVDKLSNKLSILSAKAEAVSGGSKVYNRIIVEDAKSAKQSASKDVQSAKKEKKIATKDVQSAKNTLKKDKDLTKAQKKAIQKGKKISTDGLSGKTLKDAKAYNKAITEKDTATKKVKNTKAKQQQAKKDLNKAKAQQKKYKDAPDYQYENDLLEQEIELAKQENQENQKALKKANSNLVEAKKSKQTVTKKVKSAKKNVFKTQTKLSKDKNLSKAQKKSVNNGKKINTKGLEGKTLKDAKAYNKAIDKQNKALKQQKTATTALSSAQTAQNTAIDNAAISQAEYTKTLLDNTKAKLDNVISSYDNTRNVNSAKINNSQAQIEYRKTSGEIITRKDYTNIISIANKDERVAKSALDAYKAEYDANKKNLSEVDKKAALQQIQNLEQAWYEAKQAVLDYKSESIQSEIDNTQDLLDKLKTENELLAGAIHKNENIVQQIENTKTYYDLMIEQETNAVRQAELRAEKEKAVRDLLQEQLDNIKEQNSYTSNWYTSQGEVYEAQNETLKIAQGSDNTQSRYNTIMYDKSVQDNLASVNKANAQALLDKLHTSDYGFYNGGEFVVWEHMYEQYMKGMADYNNMLADSYKAEAQAAQDCYDAWWEQYLKPKKEGLEDLQTIADLQNAIINLENTRGLDTTVSQYNALIGNSMQQVSNLGSQNSLLQEQQRLYDAGSAKYRELQTEIDNNSKAILEARKNQEEWNNAIIQIPFDNVEKVLDLLDAIQSNYESVANLKTASSEDLSDNDYFVQMETNDKKIIQRQKEQTEAYNDYLMALSSIDGVYGGKTSDEWLIQYYQYDTEINNLKKDNEELKDALRDDVYWRTYERAHDAAKKYADIISGIKDLISEDMYFDKNGKLTKWGLSQVANIVKQYETARTEVQNYSNDIENLNNLYAEGYYTEREYFDKLNELQTGMLDNASSMKSNINEIIDMYKQMAKSELDALLDLIDARNEALTAKKAYYDYDKTIKDKTKDIQALEAQIGALEGVETAEAKAKKAKLQADLAEAKEDLDDTVKQHMFELSQKGLDELKETLQNAYNDKWDNINQDLDSIAKLMAAANALTTAQTGVIKNSLNKLLEFYGINVIDSGLDSYTGYASGTRKVDKDKMAWTQENGQEVIVRKSDGAILTPLSRGDSVIPNDLTNNLFDWGMKNPQEFADSLVRGIPDVPKVQSQHNSVNVQLGNMVNIEGNVIEEELPKLKNILDMAYEHTVNEITKDARKKGIKA